MESRNKIPGKAVLESLLERMTIKEAAEDLGVSVSGIVKAKQRHGLTKARPRYTDVLPWRVKVEHSDSHSAKMLRAHAAATAGNEMSDDRWTEYIGWRGRMLSENMVIAYSPIIGFYETPRLPEDEGGFIRKP